MHYFEEDTIEGTLFNEDGTEYKTATKKNISTTSKVTQTAIKVEPPKSKERQASLWDMLATTEQKQQDVPPMPEFDDTTKVDTDTGEILDDTEEIEELTETEMRDFDGDLYEANVPEKIEEPQNDEQDENLPYSLSSFDRDTMIYLYEPLDGKLDLA
jgi:hypothetical protein